MGSQWCEGHGAQYFVVASDTRRTAFTDGKYTSPSVPKYKNF